MYCRRPVAQDLVHRGQIPTVAPYLARLAQMARLPLAPYLEVAYCLELVGRLALQRSLEAAQTLEPCQNS